MLQSGHIFIVSAASGTGKTTLVSRLSANQPDIHISISHTTRMPRAGEQNGVHYHFVSRSEFEEMIADNAFIEHANVYGNYYGTSLKAVESLTQQGYNVILEIDVQGAEQIRRLLPDATSIFILPPSMTELTERLQNRGTDSEDVIAYRLEKSREEIAQSILFDYVIVNQELTQAEQDLLAIIRSVGLRAQAQSQTVTRILAGE
ncbi:MAG: guanylate kinase [Snodgrassella sp.]|uniref:Guanylate kinase n=1 Tax=Snodgrassella alvi TaxID=1196083 RepID=A0A2N9XPW7_9NEIS|nr:MULTISPECIES: guanylate kinase [Snodgrassella]MCO6505736.1 guanylate kinase [Snodgrassella sp.]MCO6508737.1 guanylate kinase [Snodgrassella sp.]MCO6518108.1 guanylate kinase [Snodgrassella sp.]MCO6520056.1 guanylate kinase [Snodgrassella sp.]MCO6526380.1 guanylate kinase [Snodgrassella sp.]